MTNAPKTLAYYIWIDANGNEINRKVRSKGRPPAGAKLNAKDGNYYITVEVGTDHAMPVETVETCNSFGGFGLVDSFTTDMQPFAWVGETIPVEFFDNAQLPAA